MASQSILNLQESAARQRLVAACEVLQSQGYDLPKLEVVRDGPVMKVRELEYFAGVLESVATQATPVPSIKPEDIRVRMAKTTQRLANRGQ